MVIPFSASLIKNLQAKTVLASFHLKLILRIFLKCFLILFQFQSHVSYMHFSYKEPVSFNGVFIKTCGLH